MLGSFWITPMAVAPAATRLLQIQHPISTHHGSMSQITKHTWIKKYGEATLKESNHLSPWGLRRSWPNLAHASPNTPVETSFDVILDAYDDEYGGMVVDPHSLPSNPYTFRAILSSSLSVWKSRGKRGIWLKIFTNQAHLVPIAVKEGFEYHHAEAGYLVLTCWLPEGPCLLPATGSHQVGVGGFVINHNGEVLAVKEKTCPSRCSGVWKLPTGFIDKSEEIYLGAIREVKEETGVDTEFLEVVAFRHAHQVAFEKSDLFFICMLKPLTFDIRLDESEIQDAKWMPLEEFIAQPFYKEDLMSSKAIDICRLRYEGHYKGFAAHQLASKFDDKLSYLYYID